MNPVAEEMMSYLGIADDASLEHYGMPKRSGRYPWGSGDTPYQHSIDFLGKIETLKKSGWSETPDNIMAEFGLTTTQYRTQKGLAKADRRALDVARARSLSEDGLGASEIGRKMGINESSVRSLLNSDSEARMYQARKTAEFIKEQMAKKGPIDVGSGVERELNISKEKLDQALALLKMEGYEVKGGRVDQGMNSNQKTTLKVIFPPDSPKNALYTAIENNDIHSLNDYISRDGGSIYEKKFTYPTSMDSKRLKIRYAEEGGIEKDGVIELRRGVEDLSLGESRYSQVRILVDGTHYLKGMAVYSDDLPDGVDVVFNTNKHKGTPALGPKNDTVLKIIKDDPDNPFGSAIKDASIGGQYWYEGKDGKKQLGLINKRADEGDWTDWKDALPSQFLSKQSVPMAKKQLGLAIDDKMAEYKEISSLTNPTVKKHLLNKFADECDSAAVHLQAAALPGQKYHVIIPITSMKDTEVYAPNYENGTKLALIRYPHGGTFEIPILTVNNKQATAKKLLGTDIVDAVGINSKVAERLSGADFDGDTVMCIPTHDKAGNVKIASTPPLKGLEGFDSKSYAYSKEELASGKARIMKNTQNEMGSISNLITDMTLKGAPPEKMAAAVRHSMVVIDAEKHKLNYKQSEVDNNIKALKKEYQTGGASTLISRSKGRQAVTKRQGTPIVNLKKNEGKTDTKGNPLYDPNRPEGALLYKTAPDAQYETHRVNKRTGEVTTVIKTRTQDSTKMAETDDAYTLISNANTPMERAYANYANKMKALANQSRKEVASTGKIEYSKTAKNNYDTEVKSLMTKLNTAELNAPKERAAQIKATSEVNAKKKVYKEANGVDMKASEVSKIRTQAVNKYRDEVGAVARKDRAIQITDREWEAIQAGAISETQLKKILNNTDVDVLREKATPRTSSGITPSQVARANAMKARGYTLSEISNKLGISTSSVSNALKGVN